MEQLSLNRIKVEGIEFGTSTRVESKVLYINADELVDLLLEDKHLKAVSVEIARPGESKRIIPIKDVLEPRAKVGGGSAFPGFVDEAGLVGQGATVVLDGVAVLTCGKMVNFQEGLIDMSGPGAEFSLFSRKLNVVLLMEPVEGISKHRHEEAVRLAGIKAANYLGQAGLDCAADETEIYPVINPVEQTGDLPRVVYVDLAIAQGLLHDNFIYGVNAQGCLPMVLRPTELMDGAVISGNCAAPCHKNTTYHQQNNPIVEDLFAEHGQSLWFAGVIVSPVKTALQDKERNCDQVLKLVQMLGARGVIISEDGGGNPEADLMYMARVMEKSGINVVLVTDEYAGRDGASPGLADVTPEADAIVTNGNGNQYVILPPMEQTLGVAGAIEVITGGHSGSLRPDGSIAMEIAGIVGSTVEVGSENLTTIAY